MGCGLGCGLGCGGGAECVVPGLDFACGSGTGWTYVVLWPPDELEGWPADCPEPVELVVPVVALGSVALCWSGTGRETVSPEPGLGTSTGCGR